MATAAAATAVSLWIRAFVPGAPYATPTDGTLQSSHRPPLATCVS